MAKYVSRTAYNELPPSRRVLVALMNNRRDFVIARDQHWYRIPVKSAPRGIDAQYIAFYQTVAFGKEKWSIRYRAEVAEMETVNRVDLLPDEPNHPRAQEKYFQFHLHELEELERPIIKRNNALTSGGWSVLWFNTRQLNEEMESCLKTIRRTVNTQGGLLANNFDAGFFA